VSIVDLRPGRSARSVLTRTREVPFTAAFLAILLVGTLVLGHTSNATAQQVMLWASTDVDNMVSAPIRSLLASALIIDGRWLPTALLIGAAAVPLERRIGSLRTMAVFASGHVLATVLTEGGIWVAVASGHYPDSDRVRLDVGTSYGMWAMIGAALFLLPARYRRRAVAVSATYLLAVLGLERDMASIGHVVSLSIGLAWWPFMPRLIAHRCIPAVR
jgi:hypothetical protein